MSESLLATEAVKADQSPVFKFIARVSMMFLAGFFTIIIVPVGGFVAARLINTMDKLVEKQDNVKEEIYKINNLIIAIQSDNKRIDNRIDEANRMATSRIDALSAWTRKNSDEIDKVKDWFLKPQMLNR